MTDSKDPERFVSLAEALGVTDPREPEKALASDLPDDETAESFARRVIHSREYRESLLRRVLLDELPAAVEALLWHYGYGKPTERVEHTGKDGEAIVTEVRRVVVHRMHEEDEDEQPVVERKVVH
jgi:hypothetical protein